MNKPTTFTFDYQRELDQLVKELINEDCNARSLVAQQKIKLALARVKSARSLLMGAEATLNWAKGYNQNSHLTNS